MYFCLQYTLFAVYICNIARKLEHTFSAIIMAVVTNVIDILFFSLTSLCLVSCELSCKDPNGNNVDWFIVQKLPWNRESSNPLIHDGVAHLYMDVHSSSFSLSDVSLNDSNQAVGYTLKQIYTNFESQNVLYMMYNDEFPNGTKEGHGHTKGTIAFDNASGFWLVHSVPKFPDFAKNSYVWPSSACNYGQSMLCISMKTDEFVKVGKQLLYNYASAYDWNIPPSFQSKFSNFVEVSKSEPISQPPWNSTVLLTSLAGQSFTSFAKFTDFEQDLYWYLVAPSLGDDLYVESWLRTPKLPSFCNGSYHVENVQLLGFPNVPGFKETVDHSKWAIGKNKKWVCIGDINRMGSQYKRGGGTVCGLLATPWEQYTSAIQQVDKCPTKRVFGNRT
eukprot:XP_003725560.2 PREDICTED: plancitoxin-1 isoform X2 [Strongylocentrotus purpuratus]